MSSLPIAIPKGYSAVIHPGDSIQKGQVIAVKDGSGDTAVINIIQELSLSPEKAVKAIKKNPGEKVSPGEVIAARSGFMGMGQQKVVASIAGTVIAYDRHSGDLTLQLGNDHSSTEEALHSPITGRVSTISGDEVIMESDDDTVSEPDETPQPAMRATGDAEGVIYFLDHTSDTPVPGHLLTAEVIEKIIIGTNFDRDVLLKAIGMGVAGIITRMIEDRDLEYIQAKHMNIPVFIVSEKDFTAFKKMHGKKVRLDSEKKNVVLLPV